MREALAAMRARRAVRVRTVPAGALSREQCKSTVNRDLFPAFRVFPMPAGQCARTALHEAFEERAAILQFDAGLSREDAEQRAADMVRMESEQRDPAGPPARPTYKLGQSPGRHLLNDAADTPHAESLAIAR